MKKLTEMWSIKENSLAEELSKKMKFRRTLDDDLLDLDDITVQIFKASTQVKLTTYMVVEQAEFDDEEQAEQDEGIFQSTCIDVEVALGSTNLL